MLFARDAGPGFTDEVVMDEYRKFALRGAFRNMGVNPNEAKTAIITADPLNKDRVIVTTTSGVTVGTLGWTNQARRTIRRLGSTVEAERAKLDQEHATLRDRAVAKRAAAAAQPEADLFDL